MKQAWLSSMLCCIIYFSWPTDGARILGLFPMQGKSHFLMFEVIMKSLADAGHHVDVVSHFPQKKPYPNYTDIISLAGTLPDVMNNMTYEMMQLVGGSSVGNLVRLTGDEVCELLDLPELQTLIKSPPTDPPYDMVIVEYFFAHCYLAFGHHLKVPVVALSSGAVMFHENEAFGNPFNPAIVPELSERPVAAMTFWKRLLNTIVTSYLLSSIKSALEGQNDVVKKHFGSEMPRIEQLEREMSLFLANSHYIFHGIRPFTPAVVEVSGLHVRDDGTPIPTELQKWLDDSKDGFFFFSLGSMMKVESLPEAALAEIYSAFARVSPIRILMKVAKPNELPPGLPDNVKTLTWAPQVQVLKHKNVRGFMTHGGLMGLQEAVTFGVPLIGIPLFGDQAGNIDALVQRGVAVAMDYRNLKADEIVAAVHALTRDPKYKNNMNTISKQFLDRPRSPSDTAVFWIEYILKHGGDALRSPAVSLTWWQIALLDVYGTIIAVVLILLYVLKLLISIILGRILSTSNKSSVSKKRN